VNHHLNDLMLQRNGPLTNLLKRTPGNFGIGQVPTDTAPTSTTSIVCGYCSTGCNLEAHLIDGQAVGLTPSVSNVVNIGMACPKGWEALTPLAASDRAAHPQLRKHRGKTAKQISWSKAAATFCERFKEIQKQHGDESVAFISTGQIPSEEMALLGSFARFGMNIQHGDGNTRQCMATSVVAYKESFGFDAPPYTYQDFEESDLIILIGSNLCIAHPVMWQRIMKNPHNPETIVIDPRNTETAAAATQHIPLQPKSDLLLFYSIAHVLIRNNWINKEFITAHTSGFDDFAVHVSTFSPDRAARDTGIAAQTIEALAEKIHRGLRVSFWWTMGVNQSYQGVRTAQAIINLALMTGNIGKPGTGANSITGQCNAMGSRLFSNTTNLIGGHQFSDPQDRSKVATALQIPTDVIPSTTSLAYHEILDQILNEKIKGLWIIATNPAHSWINQKMCRDILSRLDFLVVQDMYDNTDTAKLADLTLPAAAWGEKEGTFINSERRVGLVKQVSRAPGEALSDFRIVKLLAKYWGCHELFSHWETPQDVFQSIKEATRDQPCDMTGIRDYQHLEQTGGIQWPFPDEGPPLLDRQRRLFADGMFYHDDGRARFIFDTPQPLPEPPSSKYPLLLITGRGTSAQWHTNTRTSKSPALRQLYPQNVYVEVNSSDAAKYKLQPEQQIIVESQRGKLLATVAISHNIGPGQVFIPMHYVETNRLTRAHFDPHSKQPSYKDCAVRLRYADYRDH
jgi:anaerobic selenocysteine-containing dehydrogenase